jgi:urease accessory protein
MKKEGKKKHFFFEKKKQKTFIYFPTHRASTGTTGVACNSQKFFGSFFQKRTSFLFLAIAALALPPEAQAHLVPGEAVGFLSGLKHPISGLDHIIAMVSVGLWGAQLGAPAIWLLPVTFPLIMAVGGFLGLIGVPLPGTEIGIALSGVLLGAAVLFEWRPKLYAAAALVGLFGLYHGHAHGAELPPGQDALLYSLGFVLATGLLHLTGITIGLIHRWSWGERLLRVAGGVVSACGLYFLWTAVA